MDLNVEQFDPTFGGLFVVHRQFDGGTFSLRRIDDGDAPRIFSGGEIDGRRLERIGERFALDPRRRPATPVNEDPLRLLPEASSSA